MTDRARRLVRVLAGKGICSAAETGMAPAEIEQAVAELARTFDDDNRPVVIVNTWHAGDHISALELTQVGRTLARSTYWSGQAL